MAIKSARAHRGLAPKCATNSKGHTKDDNVFRSHDHLHQQVGVDHTTRTALTTRAALLCIVGSPASTAAHNPRNSANAPLVAPPT